MSYRAGMDARAVVVVAYEGAELLDIACVTSTLSAAAALGALPPYAVQVLSPGGHPIRCQSGLCLDADAALERHAGPVDTVIVSGGLGHWRAAQDSHLLAHVRRLARHARRVASVCTGTSVLAAAGLLDGRRATTHWNFAASIAARYPSVTIDPDPIYVRDGPITTAAGVTSALDLTLAFVEEDHGPDLARRTARSLVTYLQRPGNQAQMSMHVSAPAPAHDVVRDIVDHVGATLDGDLSTATLARRAGVSERHLTRLFLTHLGQTPGRHVRQRRTEAAAHLLTSTTLPLARVASRCGLRSTETLRQAFAAAYGISPSRYRDLHRSAANPRSGFVSPERLSG